MVKLTRYCVQDDRREGRDLLTPDPLTRGGFKKRRCLIPVDGFYERKKLLGGKGLYSIQMKDDSPFVFAGL